MLREKERKVYYIILQYTNGFRANQIDIRHLSKLLINIRYFTAKRSWKRSTRVEGYRSENIKWLFKIVTARIRTFSGADGESLARSLASYNRVTSVEEFKKLFHGGRVHLFWKSRDFKRHGERRLTREARPRLVSRFKGVRASSEPPRVSHPKNHWICREFLLLPRNGVYFVESTVNANCLVKIGHNLPFCGHAYAIT